MGNYSKPVGVRVEICTVCLGAGRRPEGPGQSSFVRGDVLFRFAQDCFDVGAERSVSGEAPQSWAKWEDESPAEEWISLGR